MPAIAKVLRLAFDDLRLHLLHEVVARTDAPPVISGKIDKISGLEIGARVNEPARDVIVRLVLGLGFGRYHAEGFRLMALSTAVDYRCPMNTLLLAAVVVSGGGFIQFFVGLIIVWLLFYVLTIIPGVDAAILKIGRVVAIIASAVLFINWLLGIGGHPLFVLYG